LGDGVALSGTYETAIQLAGLLNAEYGGTKPLVEKSIITRERMIGISGKRVSPRLYIGLGISGSMYHMSGVLSAETIIAINRDERAPVFEMADYYLVGNLEEVLPALLSALRRIATESG